MLMAIFEGTLGNGTPPGRGGSMLGIVCEGICETCISVSISAELGSKWGAFGDFLQGGRLNPPTGGVPPMACAFSASMAILGPRGGTRASICTFWETSVFWAPRGGSKMTFGTDNEGISIFCVGMPKNAFLRDF